MRWIIRVLVLASVAFGLWTAPAAAQWSVDVPAWCSNLRPGLEAYCPPAYMFKAATYAGRPVKVTPGGHRYLAVDVTTPEFSRLSINARCARVKAAGLPPAAGSILERAGLPLDVAVDISCKTGKGWFGGSMAPIVAKPVKPEASYWTTANIAVCNPADFWPEFQSAPRAACPGKWAYDGAQWRGQDTANSENPVDSTGKGFMPYLAVDFGSGAVNAAIEEACAGATKPGWCRESTRCAMVAAAGLDIPDLPVPYLSIVSWPYDARVAHVCRFP